MNQNERKERPVNGIGPSTSQGARKLAEQRASIAPKRKPRLVMRDGALVWV